MRDGCRIYSYGMSYHEAMRVVGIARRRGDEKVLIDGRPLLTDRIAYVIAPGEPTPTNGDMKNDRRN
jgi:hypothetical protein